ncbi:Molybdopterin-synthase adenylyltransferase [Planktothrix tepida]|uniref:UBA/THIF-type NAD/FAD binding protein n=1 Tax=Planktothrix tepida PCC 9214 TaxID=671072 RepID=A0A1J1LS26_9CYAN|nr:ThiF family adenylyltransferase [Planktothrix tepida]CAD5990437.1 Molybdopterin-synthase adenylyltransferase [Planktothrix tepida]CUR35389.1 UBA/THIF-type NAD/FAD binding protein [Planktothrix tepida PCC 9214]
MSNLLYISQQVIREIEQDIAIYPPERGGALLGPIGKPIVTRFLFDGEAITSYTSYRPSRTLNQQVKQVELSENLELKGIIHSHPNGMDRPSGQDEYELKVGLELNPHMAFYLAPIVTTLQSHQHLREHELRVGRDAKISFFSAYRQQGGSIRVEPIAVQEISAIELAQIEQNLAPVALPSSSKKILLQPHLERICQHFGSNVPPEIFITEIEGISIPVGRVILNGGLELLFLLSQSYPVTPPILWVTPMGGDTEQVELPWSLVTPPEERLVKAITSLITGHGPYQKVFRPLGKSGLTTDAKIAALAGWSGYYSEIDPKQAAIELQQGLFARSTGLLSQHISEKRVLIAGTGSVGSYLAEQLVRSGVGKSILIDPEKVETANLCRTNYEISDIGQPKVKALGRRLLNINPLVELTLEEKSLSAYEVAEFDALVREADLIVATTDDQAAQRILNRFAYFHGKPALFVGLYKGAEGGEVIFTIPKRTPCYLCATANRHQAELDLGRVSADGDYGSNGRVMGEVALVADIHHVTSVAVKMALSLLLPEDAQVKLKGFLNPAIEAGFNYLTLSMVPNYWFYPAIFGDTAGQYAYQSVWLTAQHREECPVCGGVHHRVDPRTIPLQELQAGDIRAALSRSLS